MNFEVSSKKVDEEKMLNPIKISNKNKPNLSLLQLNVLYVLLFLGYHRKQLCRKLIAEPADTPL